MQLSVNISATGEFNPPAITYAKYMNILCSIILDDFTINLTIDVTDVIDDAHDEYRHPRV